jgi:hypothetical protein
MPDAPVTPCRYAFVAPWGWARPERIRVEVLRWSGGMVEIRAMEPTRLSALGREIEAGQTARVHASTLIQDRQS